LVADADNNSLCYSIDDDDNVPDCDSLCYSIGDDDDIEADYGTLCYSAADNGDKIMLSQCLLVYLLLLLCYLLLNALFLSWVEYFLPFNTLFHLHCT
jgi:hypothetical protein